MAKAKKSARSKVSSYGSAGGPSVSSSTGSSTGSSKKVTAQARVKSPAKSAAPKWPTERATLFKPDRLNYVRKVDKPPGCVFCMAVEAGPSPESLLIYEGEYAIVVLNKFPYNNAHLLVLPKRHCGDFLQLTADEHREISECMRRSIAAIQEAYKPAGFNCGLNLGAASGAGIPEHLHYHIIPRWVGDTNFFPLIANTKVVVETLEQTYARLLPYFTN